MRRLVRLLCALMPMTHGDVMASGVLWTLFFIAMTGLRMKPKFPFQVGLICVLALLLSCLMMLSSQAQSTGIQLAEMPQAADTISKARRVELIRLVRQDCGSCHGLSLKGGLGPALLPDTLREIPATSLQTVILQGRPGTAMPPWNRFLNEDEARWIVAQLQKGFPHEEP